MFKTLERKRESAKMKCDSCGHEFWCDPTTEENLARRTEGSVSYQELKTIEEQKKPIIVLVPICPKCLKIDN